MLIIWIIPTSTPSPTLLETITYDEFDLITNLTKYEEILLQLEILERVYHITTGDEVVELINNLPDAKDIEWSHQNALIDARNAYNKISDDEKLLVDNLVKLEEAEAEYNRINNGINEVYQKIWKNTPSSTEGRVGMNSKILD